MLSDTATLFTCYCRVLPPGELNSIIPRPLMIYHEAVTIFQFFRTLSEMIDHLQTGAQDVCLVYLENYVELSQFHVPVKF